MEKKDPPNPAKHKLHAIDPQRQTTTDDFDDINYQLDVTGDFDDQIFDPDELMHYFNRYPQVDKDLGRQRQTTVQKRRIQDFGLKPDNWVK